jgi:hypothetical protein
MSCVDVGNPCILVQASQLGVRGTILRTRRKLLMVSPPAPCSTLSGENVREDSTDAVV